MPRWDYKESIKELWQDRTDDYDAQAVSIAPEVSRRISHLAKRVGAKRPIAGADLEELAEEFAEVPQADAPSRAFNDILERLYDLGDEHRIWIG